MSAVVPHSRPTLGLDEAEVVQRVVLSGQLAQGAEVEAFEAEMAAFTGRRYAVAVSSGTAALHLGLLALGCGRGDEVVIPSYVCTSLLHAVWAAGATPVPADIDVETRNLAPEAVQRQLGERTRVIIAPHMFGLPGAVEVLEGLGIPVIEDCAMSIGARHRGRPVGGWGRLSICSFFATKMMATGEGGMVLTDDRGLAEEVRGLREYDGLSSERLRFNCKLTDLAAALGRVQLRRLPEFVTRRREIAAIYDAALRDTPLRIPLESAEHVYYRYVVRAAAGTEPTVAALEAEGIAARRPINRPLHREIGREDAAYPHTAAVFREDVSLPLYPSLSEAEIDRVMVAAQSISEI